MAMPAACGARGGGGASRAPPSQHAQLSVEPVDWSHLGRSRLAAHRTLQRCPRARGQIMDKTGVAGPAWWDYSRAPVDVVCVYQ